jgi:hypothetical protein
MPAEAMTITLGPAGYTGADVAQVTFDNLPLGRLGNYCQGIVCFSGDAFVANGLTSNVSAPPYTDTTNYLTVPKGGYETITFSSPVTDPAFFWGSMDGGYEPPNPDFENAVQINYAGPTTANLCSTGNCSALIMGGGSDTFYGHDLINYALTPNGNQFSWDSNRYVGFLQTQVVSLVLMTNDNAFELDNIGWMQDPPDPAPVPAVPEPSTWAMLLIGFAGLGFVFHRSRRKLMAA